MKSVYIARLFNFIVLYFIIGNSILYADNIIGKTVFIKDDMIRLDKGSFDGITVNLFGIVNRENINIALIKIINIQENTSVAKIIESGSEILLDDSVLLGINKKDEWEKTKVEAEISKHKKSAKKYFQQKEYEKAKQEYSRILQISPNDEFSKNQLQTIEQIRPKYGEFIVNSDPTESRVLIDGNYLDDTPLRNEILIGNYDLLIRKVGWVPEEKSIVIVENKSTNIKALLKKELPKRTDFTPELLGRSNKNEMDFNNYKKKEYEVKSYNLKNILTTTSIGGIVVGGILINSKAGPDILAGGLALALFSWTLDSKNYSYRSTIQENVEYNRRKKAEIEAENQRIRQYNKETERLLEKEYLKELNDTKMENEKRGYIDMVIQ